MKIAVINVDCIAGGSTGRIAAEIAKEEASVDDEIFFAYGRDYKQDPQIKSYKVSKRGTIYLHVLITRLFDMHGFGSYIATQKLIKQLEKFKPDVLWMHNIHGYYVNISVLFRWLKKQNSLKINWLLHDCWAFTGHCCYFSSVGCEKWKKQCKDCPQKKEYPSSYLFDNSKINYIKKKELFTGISNLTIYTPSKWLASLVQKSFLKDYSIKVKYNEVNKDVFRPLQSNIREELNLQNKFVILGVANIWTERKGLKDFIELSKILDENCVIILIGLSKQQIQCLPERIIGIQRTENLQKLVEYYSMADVFVNPSKEETFGLTTVEAGLCGTTSIVYKGTACEEIAQIYGGIAVNQSINDIFQAIQEVRFGGNCR